MTDTNKPKKEFKKVIVEGIAMYAAVHTPKKAFKAGEPPQYSVDLIVDDANAQKLLDEGMKVSKVQVDEDTKKPKVYPEFPDRKVFNLRRKTVKKDGTLVEPLPVKDSQGNPIPPSILIGNGSKIRVSVNPYKMVIDGKEIVGHSLLGVQVLGLVPFTSTKDDGLDKVEGGFTVASETATVGDDSDPFAE